MSDSRITQLPSLTQQYVDTATDVLPIADVSASTTKKVTPAALVGAALANLGSPIAIGAGGTGATTAAGARTALGLVIGTNVQAQSVDLSAIVALAGTSGFLTKTGAGAWALDTSTYAKTDGTGATGTWAIGISGNAATATSATTATTATTASAVAWSGVTSKPTTLSGYGITDAQPLDSDLTAIAGLDGANGIIRKTGGTWALDTSSYVPTSGSGASGTWSISVSGNAATASAVAWSGVTSTPTTLSGYGIVDAQPLDGDLTAIAGLAGTTGLLRKTAANTWELDTSSYVPTTGAGATGTWAISVSGNAATATSATTANSVAWSGVTSTPTTLSGYGITDAQPLDEALTAIADLAPASNKFPYFTGLSTAALADLTSLSRTLLAQSTAADWRNTLGLGTAALADATISSGATLSGSNTGDQIITLQGDVTGSGTGTFTATIAADAVDGTNLANNSTVVVSSVDPSGSGDYIGQGWYNSTSSSLYVWDGSEWQTQSGLQSITFSDSSILSFSVATVDGAVTVTTSMDSQAANAVLAGPTSGGNATPTFRALTSGDLPIATTNTPGSVKPGTGLTVDGAGALALSALNAAGTYTKVVADAYGRITAGSTLTAGDIPSLDASKITSGTFGTSFIADASITSKKIAINGLGKMVTFGQSFPEPDFLGQILTSSDGSVYVASGTGLDYGNYMWVAINRPGEINLQVRWGGTWNASTGKVVALNSTGAQSGLVVGQSIPSPTSGFAGIYLLTVTTGTGSGNAPAETFDVGDWLLCDGSQWIKVDVIAGGGGSINADSVLLNPSVGSYVDVQAAVTGLNTLTAIATDSTRGTIKSSTSILVNGTTGVATVGTADCGTF